MIFAIQFSATDGYSYDIQQAVGPRDTWDSWDEVKPSADFGGLFPERRRHSVQLVRMGRRAGNLRMGTPSPRSNAPYSSSATGSKATAATPPYSTRQGNSAVFPCFDQYYLDNGNEARIKTAYENRDPRLKMVVVTPYEPKDCYSPGWNNNVVATGKQLRWPLYQRGASGTGSGYDIWLDKRFTALYIYNKYVEWGDPSALLDRRHCHVDFPLIRYTDVLLQWAEARDRARAPWRSCRQDKPGARPGRDKKNPDRLSGRDEGGCAL